MPRFSITNRSLVIGVTACVVAGLGAIGASPAYASPARPAPAPAAGAPKATLTYPHLKLPSGQWAAVYSDGIAEVHHGDRAAGDQVKLVRLPMAGSDAVTSAASRRLPSRGDIIMDLVHSGGTAYVPDQVVVVYGAGVTAPAHQAISPRTLRTPGAAPAYTNAPGLNRTLARLGVDRSDRLFGGVPHQRLAAMRATAEQRLGRPLLDFSNAYVLHVTGSSVASAVSSLRASPDVAYASPDWTVTTSNTPPVPVPASTVKRAAQAAPGTAPAVTASTAPGVPDNFTLTSSAQSMLNRPADDVIPAYTAIAAHGQLPGQGEIITNVSLGDLDDASAAANPNDPCNFYAANFGPTTIIQDNQRYLDWPSMPLIPTYTSDAAGNLDGTGETCGQDPNLAEVGLDFSMMAPLPHNVQRPGAQGSGLTDLLGIAPGASYRLVVPATPGGAVSDVDAAFLAAANQTPKPNVITASLSFGLDQFGFSSRYLEDDPMSEAIIASIVHADGIVVCVSSGDGLRTFTNAAVPPSGGAVATDLAGPGQGPTDINDVAFSSAVSRVPDSGSIDVGGSTLNDIFSAPPQDPRNAALKSQQAFPAVRYNGARNYASGFGDRVNLSAPGDNVLSFSHPFGGNAQAVQVGIEGGTSASAPEVAAAAAVVLQVARLTHDNAGRDPLSVRKFLAQTGTPLPAVPQSDLPINVGPQIDVGNAVETLFARHGEAASPGAARVAVVQRRQASALGGSITTTTDPSNIPLTGRLLNAWITVSPDWTGLANNGAKFTLAAASGPQKVLATTPWARLTPTEILTAAGMPVVSATSRTVPLVYTATIDSRVVAQASVTLTFGPSDGTVNSVPAPIVDPVVHGGTLRVTYDIHNLTGATSPTLVVSQPGRVEPATGLFFRPSFTMPLTSPSGTIDVPVSALDGAGIYGVGIQEAPGGWASTNLSAFAFTRIAPTGDTQPAVPLVAASGSSFGHFAELPYGGSLQVSYDVRDVGGADGAIIEISAPGPTTFNSLNTFNNPNGSRRDANGHDSGSVLYRTVSGSHGVVTLSGNFGLDPTMNHVLRVLATRNGVVTGEASGVSTVTMDGVRPSDGGSVAAGYGVNADGTDGFVTSNQVTASGATLGSVESFRQSGNQITHVVRSSRDEYQTLFGGCAGQFAGDVGLYEDFDPVTGDDNFRILDPVAAGTDAASTWVPPASLGTVLCGASQQDAADTAILSDISGSATKFLVSTSQIAKGTFTDPIDLTPALDPNALSIPGGIGQDTAANEAIVPVVDAFNPTAPGRIVVVHLGTGQVTEFPAVNTFFADGVAVDSKTHEALIPSTDTFGLYDLAHQTGTSLTFGGSSYQHPAADPAHGEFLVQEVAPPDFFGTTPNNNSTSAVDVMDEHGNLLKRIEQFNFFNIFLLDMGSYLQVSPATSTGYTLGPGGAQLAPFQY
jgi:Subtilase family